ncbi:MAG: glucosyltransferase domain-containing protein [Solobacterium sp.]|nr:glucosyltransferase domain-containing protein [Solobacterium sp.]
MMNKIRIDDRDRLTIRSGIIFLLLAHLYRWTNAIYNHDSLLIYQIDNDWQISLGRILVPFYAFLRGRVVSPVMCAVCGSVFLLAAMVLIVRMLDIKKEVSVVLLCGMLVTHETLTFLNASFLFVYDADMLALLFSVLAVYFMQAKGGRLHWLGSAFCIAASLGLYQSYLEVTLVLAQICILKRLLDGEEIQSLWKDGLRCIGAIVAGGLLYMICLHMTLNVTGDQLANNYNSLLRMKDLVHADFIRLLGRTWKRGFSYLRAPEAIHRKASALMNLCLGLCAAALLLFHAVREKWGKAHALLILFLIIVMPLSFNISYLLSGGLKHGIMTYSNVLYFVMIIMGMDRMRNNVSQTHKAVNTAMKLMLSVLIFNHISFSNALYVRKALEYDATMSLMTRLAVQMEKTEGYKIGETPVAILGVLDESPMNMERPGFQFVKDLWVGTKHNFSISYYETYEAEFKYILGYPVNLVPEDDTKQYMAMDEVKRMPVFPYEGSVKMVGDTMVIKLSEDMRTERQRY